LLTYLGRLRSAPFRVCNIDSVAAPFWLDGNRYLKIVDARRAVAKCKLDHTLLKDVAPLKDAAPLGRAPHA
jgi:hypothetical protein